MAESDSPVSPVLDTQLRVISLGWLWWAALSEGFFENAVESKARHKGKRGS